jgi:hypothetical protein
MATEDARSLLDALMGGDRNAALPPGVAVPSKRKRQTAGGGEGQLLLPGKRNKSCYDKDIDPLYTAWGVDVYELFVNTKSDLGANPYIVDESAHHEFLKLPEKEQEKIGYHYFLFQKLQEIVRQCDRTITRNKGKLTQEVDRKLSQRGGQDFVQDVDENGVEILARDMVHAEKLSLKFKEQIMELEKVLVDEEEKKEKVEKVLQQNKEKTSVKEEEATPVKEEEAADTAGDEETEDAEKDVSKAIVKQEDTEEKAIEAQTLPNGPDEPTTLQMDLGKATMKKQAILFEIANIVAQLGALQESIEAQHRNLNYVKSDISTDKTVCEVSGNFMSSRDADERIAAHYAGKQYVGWKLVRDKFQGMIEKFGRYGPPPPSRVAMENSGPMPPMGRGRGGGGGYDRGGGFDRGGGGRGRFDGGRGRSDGGGFRGAGPDRGRWEQRGGPPPDFRGDPRGPPRPRW